MVAGLGPTLRVYIGDTIGEDADAEVSMTDTRLVLAHELGHHAHGDLWRLLVWSAAALAAGMAGAWLAVRELSPGTAPATSRRCRRSCSASRSASAVVGPLGAPTRAAASAPPTTTPCT